MSSSFNTYPDPQPEQQTELSQEYLLSQLAALDQRESWVRSRIERAEQVIGKVSVSESFRTQAILDTAEVVGRRKVTDPLKMEPEIPRATETLKSEKTFAKATNFFAKNFGIHGENGDAIRQAAEDRSIDHMAPSRSDRQADMRTARLNHKQELRQARAKFAEAAFGGGIGLGKTAKRRSSVLRRGMKKQLEENYTNGEISAAELLQKTDSLKAHRVIVPVAAVRREVRRERAGAMYSTTRAHQPARRVVNKVRGTLAERAIARNESRISEIQSHRDMVEAELSRRDHPDENSED